MQFPKDVFWVKLITSHNKICFNPINVRWLCLDPMCVCVFFMCSTCLCIANPFCSFFTVHFLPTDLALGWMIIENPVCLYVYAVVGGLILQCSVSIYEYLFSGYSVGDFTRQGLFKSWLCPFFIMEFLNFKTFIFSLMYNIDFRLHFNIFFIINS